MNENAANTLFIEDIRAKSRQVQKGTRELRRASGLGCKRLCLNELEKEFQDVSVDQVKELAARVKKGSKELPILRKLKQAFTQGEAEKQAFLKVGGALHGLIGLLTCHDASLQLEALSCVINLLTADHRVIKSVVREASPYLIPYSSSSSSQVQELAVWALGNIAADCADCCEVLRVQKFLPAILHLLQADTSDVLHSALFALRCYMRHRPEDWGKVLSSLERRLPFFLTSPVSEPVLLEAANIFFYISTRSDFDRYLTSSGCLDAAFTQLQNLVTAAAKDGEVLLGHGHSQIVTYLVRGLAGTFAEEEAAVHWTKGQAPGHSSHALKMLLSSNYLHLCKEVLWLLGNLAGHGTVEIKNFFEEEEELVRAVAAKLFAPLDVVEQSLVCLNNLLVLGDGKVLASVTVDALCRPLCSSDPLIVSLTLAFVSSSARFTDQPHCYDELHEIIRDLSSHPDETIRQLAVTFLQTR